MRGKTHHLSPEKTHHKWDNSLEPALEIDSGDVVIFQLEPACGGQITPSSKAEDLLKLDLEKAYLLGGPIHIRDARPGDLLVIDVLDLTPGAWGWSGFVP